LGRGYTGGGRIQKVLYVWENLGGVLGFYFLKKPWQIEKNPKKGIWL